MRRAALVRTTLVALSLLAPLLGLLSACSGEETPSRTTASANPISGDTLDDDDPLVHVTFDLPAPPQCVPLGRRFAIELDAEPAAGKQWRVIAPAVAPTNESVVVLGGTEFVSVPGDDVERQRLTFAAATLDEVDITVQYVGADGSPVPDTAEETVHVTVTEDGSCPPPPVTETTIALDR